MKKRSIKLYGFLFALVLLIAGTLGAVETSVWQVGTFSDFLSGQFNGISIDENGELGLAPEMKVMFSPEAALGLSLASGPQHQIYVGSSPDGKIYRVTPDGRSSVFFDPHSKYIWALAFDQHGDLYAGTGDQGKIYKINPKGEGSVFYDSNQTHIMCLAFDHQGNLLAGSVPEGLIYRISPQGKAFVIYQADLPEIHAIEIDNEGRIFAAALGAGPTQGIPGLLHRTASVVRMPTQVMTVTVTGSHGLNEAAGAAKSKKPKPGANQKKPQAKTSPSFIRPTRPAAALPSYVREKSRGELVEILPNSTVETLWTSNEASPYGLVLYNGKLVFSTDSDGEIFELNPADHGQGLRLIAETHEAVVSRLLLQNQTLYLVSSNVARLFRLDFTQGHSGTYISSVKDTRFISRWGHLTWQGQFPAGSRIDFYTRVGNSQRPDATWSDWAGPLTDADGSGITSPSARYIQWKAVLHGSESASPMLDEVSLSYLNQNLPPVIHSLNVSTGKERTNSASAPSSSIVQTSSIDVVAAAANLNANVSPASPSPTPLTISWQADDPNGDTLAYSVYVKSADERSWHLLKKNLRESSYTIERHSLPDGRYEAKVVASDLPSNPPSLARSVDMVSAPFWVDSTPPSVEMTGQTRDSKRVTVRFEAQDSVSPITGGEYKLDTNHWTNILPENGIADSTTEDFAVHFSGLQPGEHVVIFRAFDSAGNAGLGKAVIQIAASVRGKK